MQILQFAPHNLQVFTSKYVSAPHIQVLFFKTNVGMHVVQLLEVF